MFNSPLEPDVRAQVDERLKNLGWSISGAKKNVFLEQPKTQSEKKLLNGKRPDYVLYEKGKDSPLIVIETKKKGANINIALEQGRHYASILNAPIVFATDGVFYKSLHTATQKPLMLNGEEVDELIRELVAIQYLQQGSFELNTIPKEVQLSRQELINIFDEANNTLRVEGLRAGIERFGEFANILFLKLFSEIDNQRSEPIFDRKLKWDFYKTKPSDEILDYINDTVLPKISKHYKDENIFNSLQIRDGRVLKKIIDKLDPLVLNDINSDIKGDAFEYFLKATTATGNDLGEYFTPRHIVKMMVKLVNPQIGEKIYDPFCGTGGLLIESFRHIYNTMPRNDRTLKQLSKETIFGNEITNTARITKMNMILAGDGHSNIQMKNSLANPVDGEFDVVVTNMPYSQTTDFGNLYDIPSKNGDSVCVQHCIKAIDKTADNGRIAMVVPEGFLFRKDLQKTREYLLKNTNLQTIISLPQGVFLPYTGVKTNILYLTKIKQRHKQDRIWYFDIKNDGFTLDNNRRKIDGKNDIESFLENRKIDSKNRTTPLEVGFHAIDIDLIQQNDFILSGSRYRESKLVSYKWPSKKIKDLATITNGFAFSSDYFNTDNGISLIRVRDVNSGTTSIKYSGPYKDEYLVKNGDLLVGMDGEFNAALWEGGPALLNQRVCKIHSFKLASSQFVYWMIRKSLKLIEESTPYTTVKHISAKQIENIEIPFPPVEIQEAIVEELKTYQKIIKGIKLVTTDDYAPYILVNPDWPTAKLKDLAELDYRRPKLTLSEGETVSFLPMSDLETFGYKVTPKQQKTLKALSKGYTYFEENDVLVAKITPCFENGKIGIATNLTHKIGFGSTEYYVLKANARRVLPEFLYFSLSNPNFISQGRTMMSGSSGHQRLNKDFINNYSISLPSIPEQKAVVQKLEEERQIIESNRRLASIFEMKISDKIDQIWGK